MKWIFHRRRRRRCRCNSVLLLLGFFCCCCLFTLVLLLTCILFSVPLIIYFLFCAYSFCFLRNLRIESQLFIVHIACTTASYLSTQERNSSDAFSAPSFHSTIDKCKLCECVIHIEIESAWKCLYLKAFQCYFLWSVRVFGVCMAVPMFIVSTVHSVHWTPNTKHSTESMQCNAHIKWGKDARRGNIPKPYTQRARYGRERT